MKKPKRHSSLTCLKVVIAISVLLLSRCSIEDPSAPSWDVRFTIPLLSKTYTMEDLADELKELIIDDNTQEVILNLLKTNKAFELLRGPELRAEDGFELPRLDPARYNRLAVPAHLRHSASDIVRSASENLLTLQRSDATAEEIVEAEEKYDFLINVTGGGLAAQADAIKHGISKALCVADLENRPTLKKVGFLTRDAREVERKKYGLRGARRATQFSKR